LGAKEQSCLNGDKLNIGERKLRSGVYWQKRVEQKRPKIREM